MIILSETRTTLTKRNAKASVFNRIVTLICNFVGRSVFISVLGNEYLGAGGMFGNVFSVLSLCELGFGEAVSQSLYKPLADQNTSDIRKVLRYFSHIYRIIALVNVTLSMAVMPFLPTLFGDIEKIENYRAVYLLFVVHQTLSYYFAPKNTLVKADQRMYAIMHVHTVSAIFTTVFQIAFLYLTHDYPIYIFLRILFLAFDGFAVNLYADRRYPFLKQKSTGGGALHDDYTKHIWQNTTSLILHRIGGVINSSTDSILLSAYMGLTHMGIYSNYSLVIGSLGSFVALAVGAASASVGNLGATETKKRSEHVLGHLCFANFVLLTNCAALLFSLITPFISLWIGADKCFDPPETAVIIACFYMSYIRDPVQMYIHSYGVFKSTGKLYLIRGVLNFILSIAFVRSYGAVGVFAGTLISTILTAFLFEPLLLYHSAFETTVKPFLKAYYSYPAVTSGICIISSYAASQINVNTFGDLVLRGVLVLVLTNIILFVLYHKTERFKAFLRIIKRQKSSKKPRP